MFSEADKMHTTEINNMIRVATAAAKKPWSIHYLNQILTPKSPRIHDFKLIVMYNSDEANLVSPVSM